MPISGSSTFEVPVFPSGKRTGPGPTKFHGRMQYCHPDLPLADSDAIRYSIRNAADNCHIP